MFVGTCDHLYSFLNITIPVMFAFVQKERGKEDFLKKTYISLYAVNSILMHGLTKYTRETTIRGDNILVCLVLEDNLVFRNSINYGTFFCIIREQIYMLYL